MRLASPHAVETPLDQSDRTRPHTLLATEVLAQISRGALSVRELVEDCVARVAEVEPRVQAFEHFDAEALRDQVTALERVVRERAPRRLQGIPVGVKDIFNTRNMPTCMGSPIWHGFTPGNDARAVASIYSEDGLVAGKTVTAEFAVHYPGKTLNPHDPGRIPGTSSSGSAAAVAARMVPLALGTQTAGSTIRPASYCGVFGFKPSFGMIPRTGILKTLDTLDHVTGFARGVDDLDLLLDVLRVRGTNYPYVYQHVDCRDTTPPARYRVAFVRTPVWEHAAPYTQQAMATLAATLDHEPWAEVDEVELPEEFGAIHAQHRLVYDKGLSYYFQSEYRDHRSQLSDEFRELVERGQAISVPAYLGALRRQAVFVDALDRFFESYDVLLSHATAGEAPLVEAPTEPPDPCLIWTFCHAPAVTVPLFRGPSGLPFGAQFVSRRYRDFQLLEFIRRVLETPAGAEVAS